jgi:glutamyl-tRNA reductase
MNLLERVSIPSDQLSQVLDAVVAQPSVSEAVVLSTCNRVEVYAVVTAPDTAHGEIADVLAARGGIDPEELLAYTYAHRDADAIRHVYQVACGLDSMVVGDAQILGQLRGAYNTATAHGSAGSPSHQLFQAVMRVSKRVHAETDIDRVSGSLVSATLDFGSRLSGVDPAGASVLIIGAGTMGSLALATLHRAGAAHIAVANRSTERLEKLTELYGAIPVALSDLRKALRVADIVVSAASSKGFLLGPELLDDRPRLLIDLGLPRNINPEVGQLPGVSLVGIEELGAALAEHDDAAADIVEAAEAIVEAASTIVDAEVQAYLAADRARGVSPVLAALRARANDVVETELQNLANKHDLSEKVHADVHRTIHRVVQQLLHHPTTCARKLAAQPGGERYTHLLRELFNLETSPIPTPAAATAAA